MNILLQRFMANKHTTGAALVYGVVTLLGQISAIWVPGTFDADKWHTDKIKEFAVISDSQWRATPAEKTYRLTVNQT